MLQLRPIAFLAIASILATCFAHAAPPRLPMLGKARLLVIGPRQFGKVIQPLIRFKNRTGMAATFVSLEEIRSEWTTDEDDPAKIKRTIWTYAVAKPSPMKYVMLVGDMSLVPCRRRTVENLPGNPDALIWRWGYEPAELYYSNLFSTHRAGADGGVAATTTELSSWDKDGNGHFDEQHWAGDVTTFNPDQVDGCPDVALGRVPAHRASDVSTFVEKVIRYESGGDKEPNAGSGVTLCFGKTYEESFDMTRDIRDQSGVLKSFGAGKVTMLGLGYTGSTDLPNGGSDCQFGDLATFRKALGDSLWVGYLGHGSALGWDARLPNGPKAQGIDSRYVLSSDMPDAAPNGRLPIVFGCGCETGRHAPGLPKDEYLDESGKKHWFWWGDKQKNAVHRVVDADTGDVFDSQVVIPPPSSYDLPEYQPRTFATSWLCGSSSKGAIAYFGEELVCQNDMGRDLEIRVLQHLDRSKPTVILGDAWLAGQQQYWKDFHAYDGDNCVFRNARIYLSVMNFYGDPSLRIH